MMTRPQSPRPRPSRRGPWSQVATVTLAVLGIVVVGALPAGAAGVPAAGLSLPRPHPGHAAQYPAQQFPFAGKTQTTTVPDGATQVDIVVLGARGGRSFLTRSTGGGGALVSGTVPVTPGQTLTINVGGHGGDVVNRFQTTPGAGGWGDGHGGNGGSYPKRTAPGAGGGGASSLQVGDTVVAIAGGGGGAGGNGEFLTDSAYAGGTGGSAGPGTGNGGHGNGPKTCIPTGGTGGAAPSRSGTDGIDSNGAGYPGPGGGGGGGYRGGTGGQRGGFGGCGGGGGGAGSSHVDPGVANARIGSGTTAPDGSNDGYVTLTFFPVTPPLSLTLSDRTPRLGDVPTATAAVPADATGNVTFSTESGASIGTAPVINGQAAISLPTAVVGVGRHQLTATYNGDPRHTRVQSQPVPFTVLPAPGRPHRPDGPHQVSDNPKSGRPPQP